MATYAIGDIQGCFSALQALLAALPFHRGEDRLWFVGDLVNRGPDSLTTLRFVRDLGEDAVVVLGNHDLHLIMVAAGFAKQHRDDTIAEVLAAPDGAQLIDWLRHRPLAHQVGEYLMVHAGVLPQWSVERTLALAGEVQAALQAARHRDFLAALYGNAPARWHDGLAGFDRLRVIVNALTRMRLCTSTGEMEFKHKGELRDLPGGFLPWFEVTPRASGDHTVIFGHWSALGLKLTDRLMGLDSGCLWGRSLTAVRLEDRRVISVPCAKYAD